MDSLFTLICVGIIYGAARMMFAQTDWALDIYTASVVVGILALVVSCEQEHLRCFVARLLIRFAMGRQIRLFWLRQLLTWLIWNIAPREKLVALMQAAQ